MNKILYVVLDGLGDLPILELNNLTPLASAHTPYLDNLAKRGITGLVYPVAKGIAPESDIAVISILGYEAKRFYTGRGPLECFAEGLKVENGDLAYRVNFATKGEGKRIIDRRVGRNLTTEEATALAQELNSKVKLTKVPATFQFKNTIGHRGVLVIRSSQGKLSSEITNTDPAYEKEGPFGVARAKFENVLQECKPLRKIKEAEDAAIVTNEFIEKSSSVLEEAEVNKRCLREGKLPANLILTRDGGDRLPDFPHLGEIYNLRFGCFVEMPVEKGIALLTGMEVVELPLPTGNFIQDYSLRAKRTFEVLGEFDVLYIHIKGPDEPAHDGNVEEKKKVIEAIDAFFFAHLVDSLDLKNTLIAVTADHSTPCSLKAHSDDPVPLLICGANVIRDNSIIFSENSCKDGSIGIIQGTEILPLLVKIATGGTKL
jgi:2,3-bisphosphoglycerate-independent phosphoglycerate mutase